MKRIINTEKIKELLEKNNKRQVDLAKHLHIPLSNMSMALKGDRNLSMGYVFEIASFFNVKPLSLTIQNDTKQKNNVQGN